MAQSVMIGRISDSKRATYHLVDGERCLDGGPAPTLDLQVVDMDVDGLQRVCQLCQAAWNRISAEKKARLIVEPAPAQPRQHGQRRGRRNQAPEQQEIEQLQEVTA